MRIAGLQKLTLLDYPEHTAATVFLPGCNFRCPFCHNAALVLDPNDTSGDTAVEEFFAFLDKRHGLLDGVCITGGEPLLQPDLADFCARIKHAGFSVKLDTNGSFPEVLRALVEAELVDYVAMDVKNAPERYAETVGVPGFDIAPISDSISYLLSDVVPYEFRTTVVRELHTLADLVALSHWIAGASAWHLQSFVDTDTVLAGTGILHPYAPDELETLLPELRQAVPNTHLRGV
ncbi:anaerobic ribonucleoside-triphosphate reductase activating protein [Gordonibacter massiliensis (ex Traore et al. 2017)]|uniref:anaerobic ribonucleoside-triphosphate reductase activating protein n=1 Tax=Gordonibacter massiliensis (ex Traore et al. 2017) TaxID=1841863 RepID=UPI001C8CC461|nr:anaerobic ribonucleoside-triphosphate reductase activating protein [Gordonibacter massiliensis (ex Traore et al. 2017)]MBX9032952.1 anaerobic ribonucleoside-triphosphate reductase activating protein [Gordonibacter massiliensis (ex Traore et al. 2017)]